MSIRHYLIVVLTGLLTFVGFARTSVAEPPPGTPVGFYYVTEAGPQFLPDDAPVEPSSEVATYNMPDGRKASLTVRGSKGDSVVELTATPLEGIKVFGTVLYAEEGEHFTGLFERIVDGGQQESWKEGMTEALDLRGQKVDMYVKPTLGLYSPFYLSTGGYGVFVEGTWPGKYDMAASSPTAVRIEFEGPRLVFHILRAGTPMEILRKYASIVGTTILPPRWAFRPWRWRDDHTQRETFWDGTPASKYFNTEIVEDVLMMDALGIPCGVYWVDRPWAKGFQGYEDFEWDRERLPHPEEMIKWIESRDQRFLLWIAPWVLGDMVKDGKEKGYFLDTGRPKEKRQLIDFTNPEAVRWWQGYLKKVIDVGVAGFKLDRSEEIVPDRLDIKTHSGMTTREMHNAYPLLYARTVYDALKRLRGDDFVSMPRAGYAGSQQYAIFWGGDTAGTQWGLRSAIVAVQRAAVLGFAIWGSDTGGYHHGSNRETTARWLAFSAFCPLMEVGPTANRGLWAISWEPSYDAELIAMWSLYAQVHDRIGDYLYDCAARAHATGEPIVRPLWIQFPNDPECVKWWDEYTLGEDILVCPLWRSGVTKRAVYLPAGEWVDPWQPGVTIAGPKEIEVDCPLHKIPVYVREGAAVGLGDLNRAYADALERAKDKPRMADLLREAGVK